MKIHVFETNVTIRLREAARNNLPTSLALRQAQGAVDG
jgi:hypothetical protein